MGTPDFLCPEPTFFSMYHAADTAGVWTSLQVLQHVQDLVMGEFQHVPGLIGKFCFLDRFVGYSTITQLFSTGLQNTDNDLSDYFPNSSKVGTWLVPLQMDRENSFLQWMPQDIKT